MENDITFKTWRDGLLLGGIKTLKVLAILEYGFLWRHLKAKNFPSRANDLDIWKKML